MDGPTTDQGPHGGHVRIQQATGRDDPARSILVKSGLIFHWMLDAAYYNAAHAEFEVQTDMMMDRVDLRHMHNAHLITCSSENKSRNRKFYQWCLLNIECLTGHQKSEKRRRRRSIVGILSLAEVATSSTVHCLLTNILIYRSPLIPTFSPLTTHLSLQ